MITITRQIAYLDMLIALEEGRYFMTRTLRDSVSKQKRTYEVQSFASFTGEGTDTAEFIQRMEAVRANARPIYDYLATLESGLEGDIETIENKRREIYDWDVIPQSYRNIMCLYIFKNYLEEGICSDISQCIGRYEYAKAAEKLFGGCHFNALEDEDDLRNFNIPNFILGTKQYFDSLFDRIQQSESYIKEGSKEQYGQTVLQIAIERSFEACNAALREYDNL